MQPQYATRKGRPRSTLADFHALIDRSGGDDACWPWMGNFDAEGYGRWCSAYRTYKAHRLAYAVARNVSLDTIPLVRHLCEGGGNRWCCNPRHLADGTVQDNTDDRVRSGRQARGERINLAKLTADQVREIRSLHAAGETISGLGRAFGVHGRTIGNIVRRQTWGHIE